MNRMLPPCMAVHLEESINLESPQRLFIMNNKKLLIVEDDADVRLGYQILLRANHYVPSFAADSIAAMSEADKHRPDLIVLDLGLPGGGGFIVLDALRADPSLAEIPVVVVSARDIRGNKERTLKAGARAYVQKPWKDDELLAIIGQLTGEPALSVSQPR